MMRAMSVAIAALLVLAESAATEGAVFEAAHHVKAAAYPHWAHHHWVWLEHGGKGQHECLQLAKDYLAHNISVGAVNIDSTWEVGFNNFEFDTKKYPNPAEMIDQFHSLGVRVILWTTSMIDIDSPNYQDGHDKGYYVRDVFGKQGVVKWWHGKGSMIDYTNPAAVEWWHSQMDKALNLSIDGWKCDGTDPYILEFVEAKGHNGTITWHEYSDMYYGDFFDYTRKKLGDDRLIMSRPVDGYGPLYVRFSPKRVMVSGWVGDQDDTYDGLKGALKRYFQSAWDGYANFGSDIGGYRTPDKPRKAELLIRWAQLGAFSPLMENGGGGEHRPWLIDPSRSTYLTNVYRHFVDIHHSLVPYLLTTGSKALETGKSSITPLAKHESFIEKLIDDFNPLTYCYLLGDRILVAPVLDNGTVADVKFPGGGKNWTYLFDATKSFTGKGQKIKFTVPLDEFPVFLKDGAILPLNMSKPVAGLPRVSNCLTHLIVRPTLHDSVEVRTPTYERGGGLGHVASYIATDTGAYVMASAHNTTETSWLLVDVDRPVSIVHTHSQLRFQEVGSGDATIDEEEETSTFSYNARDRTLVVRPRNMMQGHSCFVRFH